MRLRDGEIQAIKESFKEVFQDGHIYLFGSRVDDTQKGGDIDLYITAHDIKNHLEKKINFLVSLKNKIGEQKIDVVLSKDPNRVIEQEAIKKGIRLL
jgi:predicted nucleotidyltransferase